MNNLRLEDARRQLGLSTMEVWVDYFALGGTLDAIQLDGYLRGDGDIGNADHNVLVHAPSTKCSAHADRTIPFPIALSEAR